MSLDTDDRIAELCQFLRTLRLTAQYPTDEHGDPARPDGEWSTEYSPAGDIAREWAHALLDAADANGMYGCRLCQS